MIPIQSARSYQFPDAESQEMMSRLGEGFNIAGRLERWLCRRSRTYGVAAPFLTMVISCKLRLIPVGEGTPFGRRNWGSRNFRPRFHC